MFEDLYRRRAYRDLHRSGPLVQERERFLRFQASKGVSRYMLIRTAYLILCVARMIDLTTNDSVTIGQLKKAARAWMRSRLYTSLARGGSRTRARRRFMRAATTWLRFMNRLREPMAKRLRHEDLVFDYAHWMESERGLAASTIWHRCDTIRGFLSWYEPRRPSLTTICLKDIDAFIACDKHQRWSRNLVRRKLTDLRGFLRYLAIRGHCNPSIPDGIRGPRDYRYSNLPLGPKPEEVKRLLDSMNTDRPVDIRDRAMIMLCAAYGLRGCEVLRLKLEDIDWERDQLHIVRTKNNMTSTFRLVPAVGNAIYRYLKEVRPRCLRKEVFVTLPAPHHSILRMNHMVTSRLKALGIAAPLATPHGIRHTLACHLMSKNRPLKVIADILGHRSIDSTRIYAKVDLAGLRHVAILDLGGVL